MFGPSSAKTELFNLLQADEQFKKVKIDVVGADKMTSPQEHAFVKKNPEKANGRTYC